MISIKEAKDIVGEYNGHYFRARKELVKEVGLAEAVFFDVLWNWRNSVCKDEDPSAKFFMNSDQIQSDSGLTYKQQFTLFNKLEKKGIITTSIKGIPPKKWVVVNWSVVAEIIRKHRKIK